MDNMFVDDTFLNTVLTKRLQNLRKSANVVVLILFLLITSCQKQLTTAGNEAFDSKSLYVNASSKINIYSYYHTYPEFLTSLSYTGDTIVVPLNLLKPKMSFGLPENPLIHTDRTKPNIAVPVDLFVKIYNASHETKDYYFEVPVLAQNLKPSNLTTALSWILRWGFDGQVIKFSYSQMISVLNQIEVLCVDCRTKSNTETVSYILNGEIRQFLLQKVIESNPNLGISNINYQPVQLDYAWSSKPIGANWTFNLQAREETFSEGTNDLEDHIDLDIIFFDPTHSPTEIKPEAWGHKALYDDSGYATDGIYSVLANVENTPLKYTFDKFAAGKHEFKSINLPTSDFIVNVLLNVIDKNQKPVCLTSGVLEVRANGLAEVILDRTLMPVATHIDNTAAKNLQTSKVSISSIESLPLIQNSFNYKLTFFSNSQGKWFYNVDKITTSPSNTTRVKSNAPYSSGLHLYIDDNDPNYSLFISGTPEAGDKIEFTVPKNNTETKAKDGIGCMDPDPTTLSRLKFSKLEGPDGLIISNTGFVSWFTETHDFDSSNVVNNTRNVRFSVTDASNDSWEYILRIHVVADSLPNICTNLIGDQCPNIPTMLFLEGPGQLGFNEGTSIDQPIYLSDQDGDPISITIESVYDSSLRGLDLRSQCTSKYTNNTIVHYPVLSPNDIDSCGMFNLYSGTSTYSTFNPPKDGAGVNLNPINNITNLYQFTWKFRPFLDQIRSKAYGFVKGNLKVTYDNTRNPLLNNKVLYEIPVIVKVSNIADPPMAYISNTADCGGTACSPAVDRDPSTSNWDKYKNTFDVISNPATSSLYNTHTGEIIPGYASVPLNQILTEGQIASIRIPVTARLDDGNSANFAFLYSFVNSTQQCSFLQADRTKITPSMCPGQTGSSPECLDLRFNYNPITGVQEPISHKTPTQCSFNIYAHNPVYPEIKTLLGTYTLYVQNINNSPYNKLLASTPPSPLLAIADGVDLVQEGSEYVLQVKKHLSSNTTGTIVAGSPIYEDDYFKINDVVKAFYGDRDLGAYNGKNEKSSVTLTAPDNRVTSVQSKYILQNFDSRDFAPSYYFQIPALPTGTSITIQSTNTPDIDSSWTTVSTNNLLKFTTGVYVELTAGAGFDLSGGTFIFEKNICSSIGADPNSCFVPYDKPIYSVDGTVINSNSSGTGILNQPGRYFLPLSAIYGDPVLPTAYIQPFRIKLTNPGAFSVAGTIQSQFSKTNTSSLTADDNFLSFESRAYPINLSPAVYAPNFYNNINPENLKQAEYYFLLDPSKPYVRTVLTGNGVSSLPLNTVLPVIPIIPEQDLEDGLYYNCFVRNPVTNSIQDCDQYKDLDGNSILPSNFLSAQRSLINSPSSSLLWKIPYDFAANGNSYLTPMNNLAYTTPDIILRIADNGFYNNINLNPLNSTCGDSVPGYPGKTYSCIEQKIRFAAIENPGLPTVTLKDATGLLLGAGKWRPQNPNIVGMAPTITMNENEVRDFYIDVSPYSQNTADAVPYKIELISCQSNNGSECPVRSTSPMVSYSPQNLSGKLTSAQFTTPDRFTVTLKPNYTDGNYSSLSYRTFTYTYRIKEDCTYYHSNTNSYSFNCAKDKINYYDFSFTVRVNNVNRSPSSISIVNQSYPSEGLNCADPASLVCDIGSQVTPPISNYLSINKTKAPTERYFYFPLYLNDVDVYADGTPTDALNISLSGNIYNKVSIVSKTTSGLPYFLLKLTMTNEGCDPGSTYQDIVVNLVGKDGVTGSNTVNRTLTIRLSNITNQQCIN